MSGRVRPGLAGLVATAMCCVAHAAGQDLAAEGAWERAPDLVYPVQAPAVATDGERIFVFGGSTHGNVRTARTQIFDPASEAWTLGAPVPEPLDWSVAAYARGVFHLMGGVTDRSAATDQHWIYDPVEDRWGTAAPMPSGAAGAAAALIDDRIIVVGGNDGPRSYSARVRVLDLESGEWSSRELAPAPRINWQAGSIGGGLFVAGGSGPGRVTASALYRYNPTSREWSSHALLPAPNEGYAAATLAGRYYCALGGRVTPPTGSFGTPSARVDCFDPVVGRWSALPPLPRPVQELGAAAVGGTLYALGGRIEYGEASTRVYRLRVRLPMLALRP
jgi:N-acetylneuraminic acid mutarotase